MQIFIPAKGVPFQRSRPDTLRQSAKQDVGSGFAAAVAISRGIPTDIDGNFALKQFPIKFLEVPIRAGAFSQVIAEPDGLSFRAARSEERRVGKECL